MQTWLVVLFSAIGVSVGVLQVWLLFRLLSSVTAKNYAAAVMPIAFKTMVYALIFTVTVLLFFDYLIPLGAGIGGGILIAAVIGAALNIKKE